MKTRTQITFGLVDVTAKTDSILSVNDKQSFVNLNDLKQEEQDEILYGTLEKNQFVLDGNINLMPEQLNNMGWWSNEMSDENGNFITPPVLTINFTEPHSSLGLTFIFSRMEDYCSHLNISYYNEDNQLINSTNFHPDNYQYVCNNMINNYKKIVVTFYSTNKPFRYLKLYQILYGANKIFEGDNLINANILEEVDLLSSEISINTLDFTAYSADDEFNIINPSGIYKSLQKRQKFVVKEILLKENKIINMGTFYLSEWSNEKDKIMHFKAVDIISILDNYNFNGELCNNTNFYDLILKIIKYAELKETDFEIEETLKNIKITGHIPQCTCREALQQIAFSVCAIVDCSRSNKIKLYKNNTDTDTVKTITKAHIFQNTNEIKQIAEVSEISIVAHNYEFSKSIEEEKLCEYIITGEEENVCVLRWDKPAFDLLIEFQNNGYKDKPENVSTAIDESGIDVKITTHSLTIDISDYFKLTGMNIFLFKILASNLFYKEYGKYPGESGYKTVYSVWIDRVPIEGSHGDFESITRPIINIMDNDTEIKSYYFYVDELTYTTEPGGIKKTFSKDDIEQVTISVYGKTYKHTTIENKMIIQNVDAFAVKNTLRIEEAYLVNSENVKNIAQHIVDHYSNTLENTFQMILDDEQVQVGRSYEVETNFEQKIVGNITQLDIDLTRGFIANVKLLGKKGE